jgi:holo-[acyl-carrier protein] synthase
MIGVDMVEIKRIEKAVKRFGQRFLDRIYTERELGCISNRPNRRVVIAELAARFAAKEAVSKALGVGIRKIGAGSRFKRASWLEIEIINLPIGKPQVNLFGTTKEIAEDRGIERIHISLTHEKEYAIAFALVVMK